MAVLLIFIDGLGIGRREESNPFFHLSPDEAAPLGFFQDETLDVIFDGVFVPTDPRLGVEGRPQSASGQTTILTGVNVPQTLGYHKQGFPNAQMREILREKSIFVQLEELKIEPNVFVNAYPPQFFEQELRWKPATTVAVEASTVRFKTFEDLRRETALFHDFTNRAAITKSLGIPEFSPEKAGQILAKIAARHRFTLFEHFVTDKIGHAQDLAAAKMHLPELAAFVRAVLANVDLLETTVLLTSDHGNIEDLSKKNHTLNDVPTIIWGKDKQFFADRIKTLADVTTTIIASLSNG